MPDAGAPAVVGASDQLVIDLLDRAERLKRDRSQTNTTWQQIRDVIYPTAASITSKETAGIKQGLKILDNTGEQAAELLAAALHAGLTVPDQPWFALRALDPAVNADEEAALWLEDATRRMLDAFNSPSGNFAPAQHQKYLDLVAFGSGCMFVEDRRNLLPLFQTRPLSECHFALGEDGRVDTNFRWYEQSARAAVQKFGESAGTRVKEAAREAKTQDNVFQFVHAVYPRSDRKHGRMDPANMAWASCWVGVDDKILMRESGYPEFPYTCPRWLTRAGESYGRGPGMKALADVQMLQRSMKVQIRGVEKMVDPSLLVVDDGVMSPVRVGNSQITHVRSDVTLGGGLPVQTLKTGGQPDLGEAFLEGSRRRIENAFLTHLIQFARDPNMTATQFLGLTEQTARVLAPILTRLQSEDLDPLIRRVYGVMMRGGKFLRPPPAIQGADLTIEYVSPMTRAQRIGEARAFTQSVEIIAPLATTSPEVMDNYNPDKIARDVADITGMRRSWLRTPQEIMAMRQARQDVAAQQAKADADQQAADTAFTQTGAAAQAIDMMQPAGTA